MPNPFTALFCCFTSADSNTKKSTSSTTNERLTSSSGKHAPPNKAPTRDEQPPAGMHNADIPLDYVNTRTDTQQDAVVKGVKPSSDASLHATTTPISSNDRLPQSPPSPQHSRAESDVTEISSHDQPELLHSNARNQSTAADVIDAALHDHTAELGAMNLREAELRKPAKDLLPAQHGKLKHRKCLVLDLDETLVHSSFKYIWNADFVIPVEIEGIIHDVYVVKRPGVDEFLKRVAELFEVVVFTASVAKYGDPLLDRLDHHHHHVHHRLFRESCMNINGNYIKNLGWLGRPLKSVIIIDNSPSAYILNPNNAVPVSSWFSDVHDNELLDMLPFLEDLAGDKAPDVLSVLGHSW